MRLLTVCTTELLVMKYNKQKVQNKDRQHTSQHCSYGTMHIRCVLSEMSTVFGGCVHIEGENERCNYIVGASG